MTHTDGERLHRLVPHLASATFSFLPQLMLYVEVDSSSMCAISKQFQQIHDLIDLLPSLAYYSSPNLKISHILVSSHIGDGMETSVVINLWLPHFEHRNLPCLITMQSYRSG
ncbi:unnamed protein product [Heterobilharzia americana]|nr:unnamed protein product [Heterobilharzia americana]